MMYVQIIAKEIRHLSNHGRQVRQIRITSKAYAEVAAEVGERVDMLHFSSGSYPLVIAEDVPNRWEYDFEGVKVHLFRVVEES
jgi:hypothetical protein